MIYIVIWIARALRRWKNPLNRRSQQRKNFNFNLIYFNKPLKIIIMKNNVKNNVKSAILAAPADSEAAVNVSISERIKGMNNYSIPGFDGAIKSAYAFSDKSFVNMRRRNYAAARALLEFLEKNALCAFMEKLDAAARAGGVSMDQIPANDIYFHLFCEFYNIDSDDKLIAPKEALETGTVSFIPNNLQPFLFVASKVVDGVNVLYHYERFIVDDLINAVEGINEQRQKNAANNQFLSKKQSAAIFRNMSKK